MRLNDAFHPQREEGIQCQAGVEAELVNEFIAYKQWTRTFLHDWLSLLSCKTPLYCLPAQWEEWLQSEMGFQLGALRDKINDAQSSKENLLNTDLSNGRLPVFTALPSQQEAAEVLSTLFTYTKDVFPLFHPDTFTDLLHSSYERRRPRDPSWWAGLNIALAIGYRYRSLHQHDQSGARAKSNVYYKNALAAVPELLLRRPDLMAVQALLGIVFLSCNGFDTPMYQNILSIAIRSCAEFGIHDTCVIPPSSCTIQEQPMLILSLGYTMDELYRPWQGLPPSNAPAYLGADSPHPDWVYESIAQISGLSDIDTFTWFRRLSIVRHKIYSSLYRAKASQTFPHGQSSIIQALQLELTSFQRALPVDPAHAIEFVNKLPGNLKSPTVSLLCAYHNTVILLHQTQIFFRAPKTLTRPRATEFSHTACVGAARHTALLLKGLPPRWWPFGIRLVALYIFSAFNILFASLVDNPNSTAAQSDLELMEAMISRLSTCATRDELSQSQSLAELTFFLQTSRECLGLAYSMVHKAQS
ncbi:hypothetical protein BDV37DRAFT_141977 [Aspergillus pseudonomiae]|uniref:Xylanolytic transcriptional activator regulatory domain-containing protein n=1 Tax=Aspergillus pseudonomiae TaxID=1506151 RepID=A0A5N7DA48_9EURO|nr:uncharacterized protein BDV37DRAFT_141977 [Aspergillus pseudonomiae]KAE8403340.1 hypothetical protein BDV37DRAFT_141977 [Aspergillus pseudonomiae]